MAMPMASDNNILKVAEILISKQTLENVDNRITEQTFDDEILKSNTKSLAMSLVESKEDPSEQSMIGDP